MTDSIVEALTTLRWLCQTANLADRNDPAILAECLLHAEAGIAAYSTLLTAAPKTESAS